MKQQALVITSLAFIMLLSETDLSSDLLLFLLVGAIPGTDYSLSSNTMLALVFLCSWVVVFRFATIRSLASHGIKTGWKQILETKERLSKRPLSQA